MRYQISSDFMLVVQTKDHALIHAPNMHRGQKSERNTTYKILLAFSGLKQALTTNPGYNRRVSECVEAARILLKYVEYNIKISSLKSNLLKHLGIILHISSYNHIFEFHFRYGSIIVT